MKRAIFLSFFLFLVIAGFAVIFAFPVSAQVLRKGAKGDEVAQLQQFLSAYPALYPEKTVSGFFGAKTEAAVRRFQKMHGIPETGIVGPKTKAKMNKLKIPKANIPSKPANESPSHGAVVKPSSVSPPPSPSNALPQMKQTSKRTLRDHWSAGKCVGSGAKTLTFSPVRLSDVNYIDPMGSMSGSHVTPVDHLYFHGKKIAGNQFDVLSPADGFIVEVGKVPGPDDYRLIIEHSCTFYSIYIHVTTLAKKITDVVDPSFGNPKQVRIPVAAGEAIGKKIVDMVKGATQVDYSVANEELILAGFVVPEHYDGEAWKIHTADPYQYYTEPLKSQLIAKTNRVAEPIAGKIDYDIDGRLVGNWFLEGTNGYKGAVGQKEYWSGHMTIAYDYYDPTKIRVSIGDWNGSSKQFAVRNNAPDPKDIDIKSGITAYELVRTQYIRSNGLPWDWSGPAKDITVDTSTDLEGAILVQLIAPRRLKMEIFPSLSAAQASGFTAKARVYER